MTGNSLMDWLYTAQAFSVVVVPAYALYGIAIGVLMRLIVLMVKEAEARCTRAVEHTGKHQAIIELKGVDPDSATSSCHCPTCWEWLDKWKSYSREQRMSYAKNDKVIKHDS